MDKKELYLKTLFCCSACDGEIVPEEISLVKSLTEQNELFSDMNIEETLNKYVSEINTIGKIFLKSYLNEIQESNLDEQDQIKLLDLAIKMIEADNQILYYEVKFFKIIRACLEVSDDAILKELPTAEDYLLPDICSENNDFEEVGNFAPISFSELC